MNGLHFLIAAVLLFAIVTAANPQTVTCQGQTKSAETLCRTLDTQIGRELAKTRDTGEQAQLRIIAQAIRANPRAWGATRFTLGGDGGLADNYCCSCVPGEDCTAESVDDVCSPLPTGADTCPAGEFRAVCTGNFCTGIDD